LRINYSTLKELRLTGDDPAKQRDFTVHPIGMMPGTGTTLASVSSPLQPSIPSSSSLMDAVAQQQQQQSLAAMAAYANYGAAASPYLAAPSSTSSMSPSVASPYAPYGVSAGMCINESYSIPLSFISLAVLYGQKQNTMVVHQPAVVL
jgi:hypothetical protein